MSRRSNASSNMQPAVARRRRASLRAPTWYCGAVANRETSVDALVQRLLRASLNHCRGLRGGGLGVALRLAIVLDPVADLVTTIALVRVRVVVRVELEFDLAGFGVDDDPRSGEEPRRGRGPERHAAHAAQILGLFIVEHPLDQRQWPRIEVGNGWPRVARSPLHRPSIRWQIQKLADRSIVLAGPVCLVNTTQLHTAAPVTTS